MAPKRRGAAVARTSGSARTTGEALRIPRGPRSSSQRTAAAVPVEGNVVPPVQDIATLIAMMANATAQLTQAVQAINQVAQSTPQETTVTQSPNVTQNVQPNGGMVDRVLDQFLKTHPPTFNGTVGPIESDAWLHDMEKRLRGIKCPEDRKVDMATFQLREGADDWWESHRRNTFGADAEIPWAEFERLFLEQYFPTVDRAKLMNDLRKLEQGSKSVREYETQFARIVRFVPSISQHEDQRIYQFLSGLREDIRRYLSAVKCTTFRDLVDHAIHAEIELKACEEKVAGKRKISDNQAPGAPQKKGHKYHHGEKQKSNNHCPHCGKRHVGLCNLTVGKCFNCYSTDHKVKDCPHNIQGQSDFKRQHNNGWQKTSGGRYQKQNGKGKGRQNPHQNVASLPYQQRPPVSQYQNQQQPPVSYQQPQQMIQYSAPRHHTQEQARQMIPPRVFTMTQQEARETPDVVTGSTGIFGGPVPQEQKFQP